MTIRNAIMGMPHYTVQLTGSQFLGLVIFAGAFGWVIGFGMGHGF